MDQIRIHTLLKNDPHFKRTLMKVPKLKNPENAQAPWRLFVQMTPGGPWAKKEYQDYAEAFATLRKYLPKCHDAAISCRPQGFPPPRLKQNVKVRLKQANSRAKPKYRTDVRYHYIPVPFGHTWCPFCRRPTIFEATRTHRMFPRLKHYDEKPMRCSLCGAREEFIKSIFPDYPFVSKFNWPLNAE